MHVGTQSEPIGTRPAITGSAQCKIMTYMTVKERRVVWGGEGGLSGGGVLACGVGVYCVILLFERLLLDRYHSSGSAQSATVARAPSQERDPFQAERAVTLVCLVPVNLRVSLEAPVRGEESARIL